MIRKPWFCIIIKMNGFGGELVNVCSKPQALTSTYSFRLSTYSLLRSCHVRADWCKRCDSLSVAVQLGSCRVRYIQAIWKSASTSFQNETYRKPCFSRNLEQQVSCSTVMCTYLVQCFKIFSIRSRTFPAIKSSTCPAIRWCAYFLYSISQFWRLGATLFPQLGASSFLQ